MTFNALILLSNAAILLTNLFCCFIPANLCTAGAYYSYLFAKLYAAHIWHAHFAADPLNR
jgi:hypothetical protein